MTRSGGAGPMAVLGAVALVPALLLWALWSWTAAQAGAAAEGYPEPVPTTAPAEPPEPALNTELLSFRRSAGPLSLRMNVTQFERAVQPLLDAVNDRSCASVAIDGRVVGERNADRPVLPASNQKVAVAAVALDVLGPDFTYRTVVRGPQPENGVIDGDVYLVGGGDPLLSRDWYPKSGLERHPVFNATSLDQLARDLAATGVTEIRGKVVGDASRYDDELFAPGWGDGVAGVEAGPYGALLANDAALEGDNIRASNPTQAAAREFIGALTAAGITVTGPPETGTAGDLPELAAIESVALPGVLAEMLTNSDNNTAELLVKEIGVEVSGEGTREAGLAAMRSKIEGWGVDLDGVVLADGSGLSLENRMTCQAMIGILGRFGLDSPVGQGMSIAGETGWLADIFVDTPVAGRMRAKTGTLNNPPFDADPPAVKALSGYLPVDGGSPIEFALILNGPIISDQREYRPIWAELVTALTSYPAVASPAALGPR